MSHPHNVARLRWAVALAAITALLVVGLQRLPGTASATSLGQLDTQLGQQQARAQSLYSSLGRLSGLITSLDGQISLVQGREAAMRTELFADRSALAHAHTALMREQARVRMLRARLARGRMLLSRQLVSGYEGDRPDLVSVVLNAHGFNDLLEQITFLGRAEHAQQTIISLTRTAKAQADGAATRLAGLQADDRRLAASAAIRVRALDGMNSLLQVKQIALARARTAQQLALGTSQARAGDLRSRIGRIQAAHRRAAAAAAARAAAAAAAATPAPTPTPAPSAGTPAASGPALGPGGGWAIPYAIVLCESGGQNLSPNSAGASGYYQITPATWRLFGGAGPAAYLAGKSEQDAIAAKIWNGGAGASNWVCAGIVGIH
ncbi:MAG: transglycosylase family protein [Solirubrobacteraceae bacterium]